MACVDALLAEMTADQLIDLYRDTLAELPYQPYGWPLDEVRESFPGIAARLDTINAALIICEFRDQAVDAERTPLAAAAPLAACKAVLSSPLYGDEPSEEAIKMVEAAIAKATA
jgi:hypothetical protein